MLEGSPHGSSVTKHEGAFVIAIVDYGAGNLTSVKKAFDRLRVESEVTCDASVVRRAEKIVVPGVGHFDVTKKLEESGLRAVTLDAIAREVPFLGICVGMQWLFESSEEAPQTVGLGLFEGVCQRFPSEVKSPHVGWNQLHVRSDSILMEGVPQDSFVYFTHSYRAPIVRETTAGTEYGGMFSSAVARRNVFGVQFHPERSSEVGLRILSNFCGIRQC